MLDIHYFREAFDEIQHGISKKNFVCNLEKVLQLDQERVSCLKAFEAARAQQQAANKSMAQLDKKSEDFRKAIQELKVLSEQVKQLEESHKNAEQAFQKEWLAIPNIPDTSVPVGQTPQTLRLLFRRQWQWTGRDQRIHHRHRLRFHI